MSYARSLTLTAGVLAFAVLAAPSVEAQVYNCNGTWTNRPCSKNAKPVQGLPPIRKYRSAERAGGEEARQPGERTRARLATGAAPAVERCAPVPDGVDVRLTSVSSRSIDMGGQTATYLQGLVKNFSEKDLTSELFVEVRPASGSEAGEIHYIGNSLMAGIATPFSIEIARSAAGTPAEQSYQVSLLHENPRTCDSLVVNTASGIVTTNAVAGAEPQTREPSTQQYEEAMSRSLDSLEQYVSRLRSRFSAVDRIESNEAFTRELIRVQAELESACDRSEIPEEASLGERCDRIREQVAELTP